MGVTLTDVLLFGKAQLADVDKATLVIYRRNILRWSALGGYLDIIVKGVSPLSLPDAIANSLSYVKAFGGTEQRNLPDNYLQRQFIYMMDGSYLLTDIVPTPDCKVEFDFQTLTIVASARTYLGCRDTSGSNDGLRVAHISGGNFRIYGFGTYADSASAVQSNTRYKFVWDNKRATITTGGTTIFDNTFAAEGTNQTAVAINGWNTAGTVDANPEGMYLYSLKIWNAQGELIANYVPAVQRGTVPVVGFYDTVSGTFKTATAGTFAAGAEAVPTPDAPMDIVSNNGVLKARHQSGLPLGYTLLEYIQSSGTQYIDTGLKLNQNNIVEVRYCYHTESTVGTSGRVFGARYTSGSRDSFSLGSNTGTASAETVTFGQRGNSSTTALNNIVIGQWNTYNVSVDGFYVDDIKQGDLTATTFETPFTVKLFAFEQASDSGATPSIGCGIGRCKQFKVWSGDTLVMYLIPAKNSSNVIGMYDLVSGQFFTNQGTGDFTAGDPVSDPVEIYTDGTQETIAIKDDQSATVSSAVAEMLLKIGDYQDVQSIIDGVVTRNVGVKVLDGTETWSYAASYSRFVTNISDMPSAISRTLPFISTHYQGIQAATTDPGYIYNSSNKQIMITDAHTSVEDWTQWLADQYAAGHPVIVVYPLATPTTETVTGQPMATTQGDNIAEITQASLSNLELEAKYQAAVSLTIQEVQDANLDPNVQVTIN